MKFEVSLTIDVIDAQNGQDLDRDLTRAYIAKYFEAKNDFGGLRWSKALMKFTVNEIYMGRKFAPGTRVCSTSQLLKTDRYLGPMMSGLPDGHAFTVLEPPEDSAVDATYIQVGRARWVVETRVLQEVKS